MEGGLKRTMRFNTLVILIFMLILSGCAAQKQFIYYSQPAIQKASTAVFDARLEPLKGDNPYYVAFQLTVKNKTSEPLEINCDLKA